MPPRGRTIARVGSLDDDHRRVARRFQAAAHGSERLRIAEALVQLRAVRDIREQHGDLGACIPTRLCGDLVHDRGKIRRFFPLRDQLAGGNPIKRHDPINFSRSARKCEAFRAADREGIEIERAGDPNEGGEVVRGAEVVLVPPFVPEREEKTGQGSGEPGIPGGPVDEVAILEVGNGNQDNARRIRR